MVKNTSFENTNGRALLLHLNKVHVQKLFFEQNTFMVNITCLSQLGVEVGVCMLVGRIGFNVYGLNHNIATDIIVLCNLISSQTL